MGIIGALSASVKNAKLSSLVSKLSSSSAIKKATNAGFTCPSAEAAGGRVKNGVPTWRYRYMGVWPNTALAPGMGAYHSSEIPMVFGATERKPNSTSDTPEQAKLSKNMMHAWAEFAKDPDNGLKNLGWPAYDPAGIFATVLQLFRSQLINTLGTTLVRLGWQNNSALNFAPNTDYDKSCGKINKS
jgi:carboxylesterase type B